ncbi:MAG: caspase family protein [Chitinophagaceae bacterium]
MSKRSLFATLIGINAYKQNPLNGCIKDVLDIDLLLRDLCSQQKDNSLEYKPLYLLAPGEIDDMRISDYEAAQKLTLSYEAPSFRNISEKAFVHLKQCVDGDVCLLFYSGHGSQVDAPPEFWHTKADRQNETMVCVDSRDPNNPDTRDLIDKELGYLIYDALQEKKVHCLVIMDCCHSGNNMRGVIDDKAVRFRHIPSSKNKVPLEKYLGFAIDNNFYEVKDGKASIKIANYVHVAAARDNEKAQETIDGGLFTSKLMEVLRAGGTAKTYRDLVQNLTISVRDRAAQQNPVVFASIDADLDKQFLGGGIIPYIASYEVRYDVPQQKWIMYGGAMHGIAEGGEQGKTTVKILDSETEVDVIKVMADTSLLDEASMAVFDKEKEYRAVLTKIANSTLKIGLSDALLNDASKLGALKLSYKSQPHFYYEIDFENKTRDYLIQLTLDGQYILTKTNSIAPLFKRERDPSSFLRKVDTVGKWVNTSELKNSNTAFAKEDFIFTLEKIEGVLIPDNNPDDIPGEKAIIQPGDEILLSYKNGEAPGFRLSIAINPSSSLQSCYVGVLYMESKFGITHDMIKDDANHLLNEKDSVVHLNILSNKRLHKTIALDFDKKYSLYGINEVTDFLKIFISEKPFDLTRYKQNNLELDDVPQVRMRGLKATATADDLSDKTDWTVFTSSIRLVGPNKEKTLKQGITHFSAFTIEAPEGLEAIAFAATAADQTKNLQSSAMRGMNNEADSFNSSIMPPVSIWGDAITDESAFAKGMNMGSDNGIQVLELTPGKNGEALKIPEGKSLRIKPIASSVNTRSIDNDFENTVIPYGFDPDTQLYFPVGYADDSGTIYIQHLPPETPGVLRTNANQTRSLGGSVKLFFKKIFKPKEVNNLVLYEVDNEGSWKELTSIPAEMKTHLSGKTGLPAILILHGIMGDSRHMKEALKDIRELPSKTNYVLTYDYETLATPISKAAENLKKDLTDAGLINNTNPLTILAHSTGGLVARWLVEKLAGDKFIKHLILVATPNAGTEISKVTSSVFGLLTHALNVTGPIKYVITGLSFLLKKLQLDPGRLLEDIKPGSKLLQELSESKQPASVRYSVIAGDTALLKEYNGDDFFLKKIANTFIQKAVLPGLTHHLFDEKANDMAVTVNSMQAIPGFNGEAEIRTVASNHLAYFKEKKCQEEILELIG